MPDFISGGFRPFEVNAPGASAASIFVAEARGGVKTSQTVPQHFALMEAGRVFVATTGVVADGLAPVQDLPTTSAFAGTALYNGNPAGTGSLCFVVLACSVKLDSGTPDVHSALFGGVGKPSSAPTTTSGNSIGSVSGSSYAHGGVFKSTPTMATTAPAWDQLGNFETTATAKVGAGITCHMPWGAFVVQPGQAFCSVVLAGAGTSPLYGWSVRFAVVESYLV
jgi:hypothetical protein